MSDSSAVSPQIGTRRAVPSSAITHRHPAEVEPVDRGIVYDRDAARLALVEKILADCGAQCLTCQNLSRLVERAESFNCCFALVGLGSCPMVNEPCLKTIAACKARNNSVIY